MVVHQQNRNFIRHGLPPPASTHSRHKSAAPTLHSSRRVGSRCSNSPAPRDTNALPLRFPPETQCHFSRSEPQSPSAAPPSEYTSPASPPVLLLPAVPDAAPARVL